MDAVPRQGPTWEYKYSGTVPKLAQRVSSGIQRPSSSIGGHDSGTPGIANRGRCGLSTRRFGPEAPLRRLITDRDLCYSIVNHMLVKTACIKTTSSWHST